MNTSDFIVYVDESGDHGLTSIDKDYPLFVLVFCCFKIDTYIQEAVPLLQKFKFDFFGHDQIILHEHHIRKQKGDFSFLRIDKDFRNNFLRSISNVVENTPVELFAVIIDKEKLSSKYIRPHNPYNIALRYGLERLLYFLRNQNQEGKEVRVIFEKRGQNEDKDLELEFLRICNPKVEHTISTPCDFSKIKFIPIFADKKSNSCGLQLADLTARPIGIHYLRPEQNNVAYDIVKNKIRRIKIFPI